MMLSILLVFVGVEGVLGIMCLEVGTGTGVGVGVGLNIASWC